MTCCRDWLSNWLLGKDVGRKRTQSTTFNLAASAGYDSNLNSALERELALTLSESLSYLRLAPNLGLPVSTRTWLLGERTVGLDRIILCVYLVKCAAGLAAEAL